MAPIIRAALSTLGGEGNFNAIDIISNDVKIESDGKWTIEYRHPTRCQLFDKYLPCDSLTIPTVILAMTSRVPFFRIAASLTRRLSFSSAMVYQVSW